MKITYRPAAIKDIKASADYIEKTLKNPSAAKSLKKKILHGISLLKENPQMGILLSRKYEGIKGNYRVITINKQLIFYEAYEEVIEIIRVIDGRTDYLTHLFE